MAKINVVVPHNLSEEEATKRIKTLLGEVKSKFADKITDLREEWKDGAGSFSFSAMGFSVSGKLTVKKSEVELSGIIPFSALVFKNKIESTIRERAGALLA